MSGNVRPGMAAWPDEKIAIIALRYIRKRSMDADKWRHTRLAQWDERIPFTAESGERPIVTIYGSPESWTLFTSRRIAGHHRGETFDVSPFDVGDIDFGHNAKGTYGQGIETAMLQLAGGECYPLAFEPGAAWMPAIYAWHFWWRKYPALDNLVI